MTADHTGQTGGEREVCDNGLAHYFDHGGVCIHCGHEDQSRANPGRSSEFAQRVAELRARILAAPPREPGCCRATNSSDCHQRGLCVLNGTHPSSRPVPVAGQAAPLGAALGEVTDGLHEWECPSCGATTRARMADHPTGQAARERDTAAGERDTIVPFAAREAAVEAVAQRLCEFRFGAGVSRVVNEPGDDADRSIRKLALRLATEVLSLPEVAALSAAGGQET